MLFGKLYCCGIILVKTNLVDRIYGEVLLQTVSRSMIQITMEIVVTWVID